MFTHAVSAIVGAVFGGGVVFLYTRLNAGLDRHQRRIDTTSDRDAKKLADAASALREMTAELIAELARVPETGMAAAQVANFMVPFRREGELLAPLLAPDDRARLSALVQASIDDGAGRKATENLQAARDLLAFLNETCG